MVRPAPSLWLSRGGGGLPVLRCVGPVDQRWTNTSFKLRDHGVTPKALNKLWVHLG